MYNLQTWFAILPKTICLRFALLTLGLNQYQQLTNYGDLWRHCIIPVIDKEFTNVACKLYLYIVSVYVYVYVDV